MKQPYLKHSAKLFSAALLWIFSGTLALAQVSLLDPASQPRFVNPLPISAVINATSGGTYTLAVSQVEQDLGLKHPVTKQAITNTKVWGYNGTYPGPTILARKNVPVNIYWLNNLKDQQNQPLPHLLPVDTSIHWALSNVENWEQYGVPLVTHLHGGHTESASDGLPDAWYTPGFTRKGHTFVKGQTQPYHYDNDQNASTIWYHDHAVGITRLNVYTGLAGFYLLSDTEEDALKAANKLPASPYDLGLAIQDRLFTADGQLHYPAMPEIPGAPNPSVLPEMFGNTILVNGKAWPVLEVEPRQYRFRLLNGSDSRFYNLFFSEPLKFWQIATEQGFLPNPVPYDQLLLATGERKEVMVDFSNPALWGKTIIMRNNAKAPYPKGISPNPKNEGQIMAFRVNKPLNTAYPLTPVPGTLKAAFPAPPPATKTRKLILFEGTDEYGRLMAQLGTFRDGAFSYTDPITENPKLDSTEIWEIYNLTPDAHPIHLHLVSFRVLSTQKFRPVYADAATGKLASVQLIGQPVQPEPGQRGYKDTYPIQPGEVARFVATFDREGLYAWHCHILSHEDHDMMRSYYVGDMLPNNHHRQVSTEGLATKPAKEHMGYYSIFPNPFMNTTTLQLQVKEDTDVGVRILDLQGRVVKSLASKTAGPGTELLTIDATHMSSGLYICEIQLNGEIFRERLVVSK